MSRERLEMKRQIFWLFLPVAEQGAKKVHKKQEPLERAFLFSQKIGYNKRALKLVFRDFIVNALENRYIPIFKLGGYVPWFKRGNLPLLDCVCDIELFQ